jgi:hypothetical protein
MAKYNIVASRFNGVQMVLTKYVRLAYLGVPAVDADIGEDFEGYIYDKEQETLHLVGPEVFSRGYWEVASGTIELDLLVENDNARRNSNQD